MSEEILNELREQTKFLRFLALPNIKNALVENIATEEQKKVYEFTDGLRSTRDISRELASQKIKVSYVTISRYWKKWAALGIVTEISNHSGRYQKIITLSEVGLQ